MQIRVGFDLVYECPQLTLMIEIRQDGLMTAATAADWATRPAETDRLSVAEALRLFR